jgi:Membrane bound beta barrel domain (DUF5777)
MIFKKRLLVAIPVLVPVCAGMWSVYEYRKPHTGLSQKSTNVYTNAAKLNNDFSANISTGINFNSGFYVFQLNFTNSQGIIEPYYLAKTTASWSKGGIHFVFKLSKVFNLQK